MSENCYVYESHLGGLYTSEEFLGGYLYCETCGDSDVCLGNATSWEEFLDIVSDEVTFEDLEELKECCDDTGDSFERHLIKSSLDGGKYKYCQYDMDYLEDSFKSLFLGKERG
jgi:hypothetical protein